MAELPQQPRATDTNPTEISVGTLNLPNGGGSRVTLSIIGNVVQTVIVLSPKEAAAIGGALNNAAMQLSTGLFVPAKSLIKA